MVRDEGKIVSLCRYLPENEKQVGLRNAFQSLQYFCLYQSHKCAQKLIQSHKLDMVVRFCIPHSTKYPQNFRAWANCRVQWIEGGAAKDFTPL